MIAIIRYNAGNIRSVQNALLRLGYDCRITDNIDEITGAEKVIFPGVGEASSAMRYLKERELDKVITSLKQPVLGICLGLQLMTLYTEEGDTECLKIFNTSVRLFPQVDKVPHMGWNNFFSLKGELFSGISASDNVYYVHSYYPEISTCTTAVCDYILPFSAAMFHPEKSASAGEQILKNFLEL
jgi:glutamine amidotransferase